MPKQQKIAMFQQNGSGEAKIKGIRRYGQGRFEVNVFDIDTPLPPLIEDGADYLPGAIDADIVLDYLKHPDLSADLAALCRKQNIPVVASGKKLRAPLLFTPPTCCGLPRDAGLGLYGKHFGAPEFEAKLEKGVVSEIRVKRGAPCGATWQVVEDLIGLPAEKAIEAIGLRVQFFCVADPAGWDPVYGKSPVHFAGKIHAQALKKAIGNLLADEK